MSGEVDVTDHTGKIATLVPGSIAYFPAGAHAIWVVKRPLRKLAVFRSHKPSLPRRVLSRIKVMATGGGLLGALVAFIDP